MPACARPAPAARVHQLARAGRLLLRKESTVNPGNVNNNVDYPSGEGSRTAATNNLTWAIAIVLIIAALAIAIVFVYNSVHA
jgi:hypothetical protein